MTGVPAEERSDAEGWERNPSYTALNKKVSPLGATESNPPVLSPTRGFLLWRLGDEGLTHPRYHSVASTRLWRWLRNPATSSTPPQADVIPGWGLQPPGPRNPVLSTSQPNPVIPGWGLQPPGPRNPDGQTKTSSQPSRVRPRRSLSRHPPRALPRRPGFRLFAPKALRSGMTEVRGGENDVAGFRGPSAPHGLAALVREDPAPPE